MSVHRLSLAVVAPLLAVVAAVHGIGMGGNPVAADDEGTYVAQAWSVQFHHALSPYTYWYDHPPLGWVQLAGWTWLTHGFGPGTPAVVTGRQFMLVVDLVGAALLFLVSRRLNLTRAWSAVVVLIWSLSPLAIAYQRMVYLDNIAVVWLLAALALALSPRRNLWAFVGSGFCLAVAVLSKETTLIFAPAIAWQVWQRCSRRTRAFCLTGMSATFILIVAGFPLYALLKGELLPGRGHVSLFDAIYFQLAGRQSSGSPLTAGSVAHSVVAGWVTLDPWLLGLACLLVSLALTRKELRPVGLAFAIGVLMVLRGGYLPQPFLIGLLPFAALVIGGVGKWSLASRHRDPGRVAAVGSVLRRAVAPAWLLAVAVVSPAWGAGIHAAMTTDQMGPLRSAEAWVESHVPRSDRVMVDDTMWVDLVRHGFNPHRGVVWFYKLGFANNLDPPVSRSFPQGWRDFQYVVSTNTIRIALLPDPNHLSQVGLAMAHSRVIASFGTGDSRIEIRRIEPRRLNVVADRSS